MRISVILRFAVLFVLWALLVGYIVLHVKVTLYIIFVTIASAIIIFVPMYKKYVKNDQGPKL